ncbi:MAG: hypothetical protein QW767_06095 [Thermoprotei archaeon]
MSAKAADSGLKRQNLLEALFHIIEKTHVRLICGSGEGESHGPRELQRTAQACLNA